MSDLVQARLHFLQNPADCSSARKLLCNLNSLPLCGYGCSLHHAVYCLLVAYGTKRTLIFKSKGWSYNKKGFENVFLPLSETCTEAEGGSRSSWPGKNDTQIVELPMTQFLGHPVVPADLVQRISRLHGDPLVWWVSQFLLYMLRPQPHLKGDSFLLSIVYSYPAVNNQLSFALFSCLRHLVGSHISLLWIVFNLCSCLRGGAELENVTDMTDISV